MGLNADRIMSVYSNGKINCDHILCILLRACLLRGFALSFAFGLVSHLTCPFCNAQIYVALHDDPSIATSLAAAGTHLVHM
jgi:hypothetical protein